MSTTFLSNGRFVRHPFCGIYSVGSCLPLFAPSGWCGQKKQPTSQGRMCCYRRCQSQPANALQNGPEQLTWNRPFCHLEDYLPGMAHDLRPLNASKAPPDLLKSMSGAAMLVNGPQRGAGRARMPVPGLFWGRPPDCGSAKTRLGRQRPRMR